MFVYFGKNLWFGSVFTLVKCSPVLFWFIHAKHLTTRASNREIWMLHCWWSRHELKRNELYLNFNLSFMSSYFDMKQCWGLLLKLYFGQFCKCPWSLYHLNMLIVGISSMVLFTWFVIYTYTLMSNIFTYTPRENNSFFYYISQFICNLFSQYGTKSNI